MFPKLRLGKFALANICIGDLLAGQNNFRKNCLERNDRSPITSPPFNTFL